MTLYRIAAESYRAQCSVVEIEILRGAHVVEKASREGNSLISFAALREATAVFLYFCFFLGRVTGIFFG
jgi:hypothetical protein